MYSQITSNKRKTVFLIIFFVIIILFLGYIVGELTTSGPFGLFLAFIISIVMAMFSYFNGDQVALATTGAKFVKKEENEYLYNLVENLSITAGLPMPRIYIIEDEAINAFATGRNPKNASIAVTRGAITKLENEELEGVLAHELSHIKNYDIRLMTIIIVLAGTVSILTDIFWRSSFRGSRNNKNGGALVIIGLALLIFSPIISQLIKLSISRKREYLADADGVLLTRFPDGLANALEKIKTQNLPLQKASRATAHLFIANPFSGKMFGNFFSTHPPIDERIKRLREMGR